MPKAAASELPGCSWWSGSGGTSGGGGGGRRRRRARQRRRRGEEGRRRRSKRRRRRRRQSLSAGLVRARLLAPLPPVRRCRRIVGAAARTESERGVDGGRWPGSAGASNGEVLRVAEGAPGPGAGAAALPPAACAPACPPLAATLPPPPTHTHRPGIDGNVCEETAETQ